ncbi:hypothetical protein E4U09_005956 [Claviceps aff. purpurea]|uniref:Uncharacterized protein n=1 Tax=Claviceps aff. purpurea TaxID=1967640 RepID=A0A9P7U5I4_9HYPO|nr:hypothetical protein E4U09_005956 [Claviceps aff. purpurea]
MPNEPSDPETPATPATPVASSEDTFKLLEELLEARRNREFLGPKDLTAPRVYEKIAKLLQNLHPSDPGAWDAKRVRSKHDDLAKMYRFWYIACNFSGCHADRRTGKISYDAEERKTYLMGKYGISMRRIFKIGLL